VKIVYLTIELFRICSKVDVIFIFHNFQPENFPSLTRIHFEARHTMAKSKSFCSNFDYYKNGKILFGNSLLSFLNNEWRNFCWPTVKYDPYLPLSPLSLSLFLFLSLFFWKLDFFCRRRANISKSFRFLLLMMMVGFPPKSEQHVSHISLSLSLVLFLFLSLLIFFNIHSIASTIFFF
jgi:hypothetical protein